MQNPETLNPSGKKGGHKKVRHKGKGGSKKGWHPPKGVGSSIGNVGSSSATTSGGSATNVKANKQKVRSNYRKRVRQENRAARRDFRRTQYSQTLTERKADNVPAYKPTTSEALGKTTGLDKVAKASGSEFLRATDKPAHDIAEAMTWIGAPEAGLGKAIVKGGLKAILKRGAIKEGEHVAEKEGAEQLAKRAAVHEGETATAKAGAKGAGKKAGKEADKKIAKEARNRVKPKPEKSRVRRVGSWTKQGAKRQWKKRRPTILNGPEAMKGAAYARARNVAITGTAAAPVVAAGSGVLESTGRALKEDPGQTLGTTAAAIPGVVTAPAKLAIEGGESVKNLVEGKDHPFAPLAKEWEAQKDYYGQWAKAAQGGEAGSKVIQEKLGLMPVITGGLAVHAGTRGLKTHVPKGDARVVRSGVRLRRVKKLREEANSTDAAKAEKAQKLLLKAERSKRKKRNEVAREQDVANRRARSEYAADVKEKGTAHGKERSLGNSMRELDKVPIDDKGTTLADAVSLVHTYGIPLDATRGAERLRAVRDSLTEGPEDWKPSPASRPDRQVIDALLADPSVLEHSDFARTEQSLTAVRRDQAAAEFPPDPGDVARTVPFARAQGVHLPNERPFKELEGRTRVRPKPYQDASKAVREEARNMKREARRMAREDAPAAARAVAQRQAKHRAKVRKTIAGLERRAAALRAEVKGRERELRGKISREDRARVAKAERQQRGGDIPEAGPVIDTAHIAPNDEILPVIKSGRLRLELIEHKDQGYYGHRFEAAIRPAHMGRGIRQVGKEFVDTELARVDEKGRIKLREDSGYVHHYDPTILEAEPGYLYRGISAAEMRSIKETGRVQSKGEYNIGDTQKGTTSWSTDPRQAQSYASGFAPWQLQPTFREPGFIIRIPEKAANVKRELLDTERDVAGAVPASAIDEIIEVRPYAIREGKVSLLEEGAPEGTVRSSSRTAPSGSFAYKLVKGRKARREAFKAAQYGDSVLNRKRKELLDVEAELRGYRKETAVDKKALTAERRTAFDAVRGQAAALHAHARGNEAIVNRLRTAERHEAYGRNLLNEGEVDAGRAHIAEAQRLRRLHDKAEKGTQADYHAEVNAAIKDTGSREPIFFHDYSAADIGEPTRGGKEVTAAGAAKSDKRKTGQLRQWGLVDNSGRAVMESIFRDRANSEMNAALQRILDSHATDYPMLNGRQARQALRDGSGPTGHALIPLQDFKRAYARGDWEHAMGMMESAMRDRLAEARTTGTGKQYAWIPNSVLEETYAQAKGIPGWAKGLKAFGGAQSALLLGTSPTWVFFQGLATPLVLAARHPGHVVNPVKWGRVARDGYLFWKELSKRERHAISANFGGNLGDVHGFKTETIGPTFNNIRSMSDAAKASKRSPVVRWIADLAKGGGPLIKGVARYEAALRTLEALIESDKLLNPGIRSKRLQSFAQNAAKMDAETRAMVERISALPRKEQLRALADPRQTGPVLDRVESTIGDWTAMTARERQASAAVIFYPFVRFSLRWLFHTFPRDNPVKAAILFNLAQQNSQEVKKLIGGTPSFFANFGIIPYRNEEGKVDAGINLARAAPGSNAIIEGLGGGEQLNLAMVGRVFQPVISAAVLQGIGGLDPFSGEKVGTNAGENFLLMADQLLGLNTLSRSFLEPKLEQSSKFLEPSPTAEFFRQLDGRSPAEKTFNPFSGLIAKQSTERAKEQASTILDKSGLKPTPEALGEAAAKIAAEHPGLNKDALKELPEVQDLIQLARIADKNGEMWTAILKDKGLGSTPEQERVFGNLWSLINPYGGFGYRSEQARIRFKRKAGMKPKQINAKYPRLSATGNPNNTRSTSSDGGNGWGSNGGWNDSGGGWKSGGGGWKSDGGW